MGRRAALVERGYLLHQDRQYEAALACSADALRILPHFAPAYRLQAQTLLALAKADEEKLLRQGGGSADAGRTLRRRYVEAGQALGHFLERQRGTSASDLAALHYARAASTSA